MEITKREVIGAVAILAALLTIGSLISGKIQDHIMDIQEKYNKAIKIEDRDIFEYGMRTNIGNAFVYGDLDAVDTVSYPEIGGEYMYVEKVKERYTRHTRTVTTTVNGKVRTRTQVYWSWDRVGSEDVKCKEITFLGVLFDSDKIQIPSPVHLTTIKESYYIRYKYYGTPVHHTGTIFTSLDGGTISDQSPFYEMNIQETVKYLDNNIGLIAFWIFWIILMCGCVYGWFYLDNYWLE